MPEADYVWLPKDDLLHFEEISILADIFISLGVDRMRLTGGEPLLRRNLSSLVAMLSAKPGLTDLALTSNGVLLSEQVDELKAAGLRRLTVSLDTLRPDRFTALARFDELTRVKEGIAAAARAFGQLKIDSVVIKKVNDDELVDLIEYGKSVNGEVRFIEYMDVGGATEWSMDRVVSRQEMLELLAQVYGVITPIHESGWAPAERFALQNGAVIGIIASTTEPFCRTCDRSRLTADGTWLLCLYGENGLDLRQELREGWSDAEIAQCIEDTWRRRYDRGAELRVTSPERGALYQLESLRADPHREMHTRGG
jgi:cyclic pyranopterin phosphate synthase